MYNNVPTQLWMLLDKSIKNHLVKVFDIKRTGITEIRDQVLVLDGYSNDDLKAITLEKMNEYIGSQETFPRAWELTCAKAKYEINPPIDLSALQAKPIESEVINENKIETNDNKTKEGQQDEGRINEGNGDESGSGKAKAGRQKNIR